MATAVDVPAGEIHVWVASLDRPADELDALSRTLSPAERRQARHLAFARDARRFAARRGLRRAILARYTGSDPARLEFVEGERGKPRLAGTPLEFSCSHSRGLALYAVGDRRVGVDVERLRPVADAAEIARTVFAPEEEHAIRALPPREREEAFFHCWTRKEAYLKALGSGLARLDEVVVTVRPSEPARFRRLGGDPAEAGRWSLAALRPDHGHVGAVAAEGGGWRVAWRRW